MDAIARRVRDRLSRRLHRRRIQSLRSDPVDSALAQDPASMVGRIGSVELSLIRRARLARRLNVDSRRLLRGSVAEYAVRNAGIFPNNPDQLATAVTELENAIAKLDVVAVWGNFGEAALVADLCPRAKQISLRALEPFRLEEPWSQRLEGRRVAVLHPFASTIESQYLRRRREIFPSRPEVLPDFDLVAIPAVQSAAYNPVPFEDWSEALDHQKAAIEEAGPEVILIGAGAYGLPLAAYAKSRGIHALHIGGSLQLLFGIMGARWASRPEFARLANEAWARPADEDKPKGATQIEGGAYW